MAIKIGTKEVVDVRVGSTPVEKAMIGSELVWQRRLIEGVDYERYQWLTGDGSAWIDTEVYANGNSVARMTVRINELIDTNQGLFGSRTTENGQNTRYFGTLLGGGHPKRNFYNGYHTYNNSTSMLAEVGGIYNIEKTNNLIINNIIISSLPKLEFTTIAPIPLFGTKEGMGTTPNFISRISIHYFEIDNIIFNPIRLVKDIPKYLAADNKTHPSGECGMINEVSGKFFGNANTTGAFSVSND